MAGATFRTGPGAECRPHEGNPIFCRSGNAEGLRRQACDISETHRTPSACGIGARRFASLSGFQDWRDQCPHRNGGQSLTVAKNIVETGPVRHCGHAWGTKGCPLSIGGFTVMGNYLAQKVANPAPLIWKTRQARAHTCLTPCIAPVFLLIIAGEWAKCEPYLS